MCDIDSDRLCGIQYRICPNRYIYFIQVYAPCSNYSVSIYRDFVDLLQTVISMYADQGVVIVMGDLNAHLQGQRFIPIPIPIFIQHKTLHIMFIALIHINCERQC